MVKRKKLVVRQKMSARKKGAITKPSEHALPAHRLPVDIKKRSKKVKIDRDRMKEIVGNMFCK